MAGIVNTNSLVTVDLTHGMHAAYLFTLIAGYIVICPVHRCALVLHV